MLGAWDGGEQAEGDLDLEYAKSTNRAMSTDDTEIILDEPREWPLLPFQVLISHVCSCSDCSSMLACLLL